jgi:hypothetical protein
MKNSNYGYIKWCVLIIIIISLYFLISNRKRNQNEGFTGSDSLYGTNLAYSDFDIDKNGNYTSTASVQGDYLLNGYYPKSKTFGVRDINSIDVWWQYPQFQVGSYEQITNNIRYSINPDLGGCMPVEFCDTMYDNKQNNPSNIVKPLSPVGKITNATSRNGYFISPGNLNQFYNESE